MLLVAAMKAAGADNTVGAAVDCTAAPEAGLATLAAAAAADLYYACFAAAPALPAEPLQCRPPCCASAPGSRLQCCRVA